MSTTSYQLVLTIQTYQNEQVARSTREFANSIILLWLMGDACHRSSYAAN